MCVCSLKVRTHKLYFNMFLLIKLNKFKYILLSYTHFNLNKLKILYESTC